MHMTGIFIYIFWIILYEIRNLIEETKQRYSTKDVSNSEKAIQFCFCIKWTLQILKHISSIKTHCSWSMTDLLQSVCPLALCELHLISTSQVDLLKGARQLLYTSCRECRLLKAWTSPETRQNGCPVNCYTSIISKEQAIQKSVTAHSGSGLSMRKMNISDSLRG